MPMTQFHIMDAGDNEAKQDYANTIKSGSCIDDPQTGKQLLHMQ